VSPAALRGLVVFLIGLVLLVGALAFEFVWQGSGEVGAPAGISIGGPFNLVDQNGATRTNADFRGKLMLVYFGYTYCPDACPTALQEMSQVVDALGDKASEVQPLFITVDPERDTVAQMKTYASNFSPQLVALTGTPAQTAAAARAYRVYFAKVKQAGTDDYLMDHSSFIFLMGRDGNYLTHFAPGQSAEAMATAIRRYL
jgi:cytochrome oxidase Cu insertion factor (SCO1/SenC/PrrC family)